MPHRNQLLRRTSMRLAIVTSHAHRLGLAQHLRRHCLGVGVRPLLRVWAPRSPVARGQQEAAAQEIEARPAKHGLNIAKLLSTATYGYRQP